MYVCMYVCMFVCRGKSLTRTPLRIGVDIVKNIVEKHGCFVLVVNWPQNRRRVQITTYNYYNQQKNCGRFKKNCERCALGEAVLKAHRHYPQRAPGAQWTIQC